MKAGKLRERITIQAPATGQNAYGEPNTGWTDVVTSLPADVHDLSGREYLAAAATQNAVQTKITIRYLAGLTAAMRVVHGADLYNIEAVLAQGKTAIVLMCSRGLNDG